MSINLLILCTSIITAILAIVSATSTIWDREKFAILKFTKAGWAFVFFSVILLVLPMIQNVVQAKIDKNKEVISDSLSKKRDSDLQNRYESSLNKNMAVVTTVLAKYGYELDTAKMLLQKRTVNTVKVIETESPALALNPSGITALDTLGDIKKFQLPIGSYGAGSCDFKLKVSAVTRDSANKLDYAFKLNPIPVGFIITKDGGYNSVVGLRYDDKTIFIYFWIRGSYKNIDKTKTFNYNTVYSYDIFKKETRICIGKNRDEIIEISEAKEK